ncbi:MAG: winged helix-turn-helix domain-containing protein, partial [Casimicrobiaceae bacterium]
MARRAQGALLPLQSGRDNEGLGLAAQIYKTCLGAIVEGRLAAGGGLPAARQLAADWHVSRNTVDEALGRLQSEGFLVRRVGGGTFVAADVPVPNAKAAPARVRGPAQIGMRALANVSAR